MVQLLVLGGQPATAREAFDLLQQNRVVGLLRLDLPTVLALPLYYLVFLGLFTALRPEDPAGATLATALAFVGVTLVLATPMGLSMLPLSDKYAAATSDETRRQLLATGEAILATDMWHSTAGFVGGLLAQSGAVLVSFVMLRTRVFSRTTAWVGLLTHGLDLAHIAVIPFAPGIGALLMMAAGPLYLIWFPLVGGRLLQLEVVEAAAHELSPRDRELREPEARRPGERAVAVERSERVLMLGQLARHLVHLCRLVDRPAEEQDPALPSAHRRPPRPHGAPPRGAPPSPR